MTIFTVIGGFIVGYISGWEMSLVMTAALPFVGFSAFLFNQSM